MDLSKQFKDEYIEKTAQDLAESLMHISDWHGCTRLDIATELNITVSMLEKAMKLSDELNTNVQLIEQRTLLEDVKKLSHQIYDRKVNIPLAKFYLGVRHGITDRTVEDLFRNDSNVANIPKVNYSIKQYDDKRKS